MIAPHFKATDCILFVPSVPLVLNVPAFFGVPVLSDGGFASVPDIPNVLFVHRILRVPGVWGVPSIRVQDGVREIIAGSTQGVQGRAAH